MEKKVSIIIPCYNAELFIKECIDSIVGQSIGFENIELFIIDDASTDASLDILSGYKELYPDNIRIESLDVNQGQANARNIGIRLSSAPYLIFVDADDWLERTMCETLWTKAEEYQCDIVECGYIVHLDKQVEVREIVKDERYFCIHSIEERKQFINEGIFGGGIGRSCFRREFLRKNQIEFKDFAKYEDNYFSGISAYRVQNYCALSEKLYHYRIRKNSNSHVRNDVNHFARLEVELEKLTYYQQYKLYDIYYEEIRNVFLEGFYLNTLHVIFCLFDDIPIDIIKTIQLSVKEIYPDYMEYYYRNSEQWRKYMILSVAFDFPIEVWRKIKEAYLKLILYGSSDEIVGFIRSMEHTLGLERETIDRR